MKVTMKLTAKVTAKVVTKTIAGLVLAVGFSGAAMANLIVGNAVYQEASYGQQSDANTSAMMQTFNAPVDKIVESITWWGFHGTDSNGAGFDHFVVKLGDVIQIGALTVTHISNLYYEYTLDITDTLLLASNLSISNDSTDVEWYWQSAASAGNANSPDDNAVAFRLNGASDEPPINVPEPGPISLMLLALAGMFVHNRRV